MRLSASVAAIVTGGASGLGFAAATALRATGVKVALFDINAEVGKARAAEIGAEFIHMDVLSDASVDVAFERARLVNGQERILVNCAGGGNAIKTVWRDKLTGGIKRFSAEDFTQVLMLNTVGTFRCMTRSTAGMMETEPIDDERGVVINTSSVAAEDGQIGQAAYSASKAAVMGMTLPVARDLSSEGIRINAILPGIFETPLIAGLSDKVRRALAESIPFPKRFGAPLEFASLVLEMVRNRYLNGASVRLDGAIRCGMR